jgi:hypothetical protein
LGNDDQGAEADKQQYQDATLVGLCGVNGKCRDGEEAQSQCSEDCFHDVLLFKIEFSWFIISVRYLLFSD